MSNESASYSAGGIIITCPHCNNNSFYQGKAQLNTRGATFLGFDWLNKSATTLVCSKCGLIQWFAKDPERI